MTQPPSKTVELPPLEMTPRQKRALTAMPIASLGALGSPDTTAWAFNLAVLGLRVAVLYGITYGALSAITALTGRSKA